MAKDNARSEGYARRWKGLAAGISPGSGDESPARVSLDEAFRGMVAISHALPVKRPVVDGEAAGI
jgi:hypothetical protein